MLLLDGRDNGENYSSSSPSSSPPSLFPLSPCCSISATDLAAAPLATDPQTPLPAVGSSAPGNFTFVNQADDLVSLTHRKISNTEQRHAIRSHVMQRVRKEELAQGKKRPTGRDLPKRTSTTQSFKTSPTHSDLAVKDELVSVSPTSIKEEPNDHATPFPPAQRLSQSSALSPRSFRRPSLHLDPAVHEFDPFQTLPSGRVSHKSLEGLLTYCRLRRQNV